MRTFPLHEATMRQVVTHLTHIEDLILTDYARGAEDALRVLQGIANALHGHADSALNLTVKFDGAPSVVLGPDPADGRFFVGTKGAFSKTPKIAKSLTEVETLYAHAPGLRDVMSHVFRELCGVTFPAVVQGDVMFTPAIKHVQNIENVKHVTFRPNTILYAVPVASALGSRIARATLGLALHTTYTGTSLSTLSATPGVRLDALKTPPSVVLLSPEFRNVSGTATFTKTESAEVQKHLATLASQTLKVRNSAFLALLEAVPKLRDAMMRFQNSLVRAGKPITLPPADFAIAFVAFMHTIPEFSKLAPLLSDADVAAVLNWQRTATRIKTTLLTKMQTGLDLSTYYETDAGLVAGAHEGFVAADSAGTYVKLVDRSTFSRINMTASRFTK